MWAALYTCYGWTTGRRHQICSPLPATRQFGHLELKPSDSSANPYLALGVRYAGLDGIRASWTGRRDVDPAP